MEKTFITGFDAEKRPTWFNTTYIQHAYISSMGYGWEVRALLASGAIETMAKFDTEKEAVEAMEKVFGKLAARDSAGQQSHFVYPHPVGAPRK